MHRMLVALLLIAGCSRGPGHAQLEVPFCGTEAIAPDSHFHLPRTAVGKMSQARVWLKNSGAVAYRVEAITASCPWANEVRLPQAGFEVAPGERKAIDVGYAPTDVGAARDSGQITFRLSGAQVDELVAHLWPGEVTGNLTVPEHLGLGETTVGTTVRGELIIANPTDIEQEFTASHANSSFSSQLTLVEGSQGRIGPHETRAVVLEYDARLPGGFSWRIDVRSAGSLVGTVTVTGSASHP